MKTVADRAKPSSRGDHALVGPADARADREDPAGMLTRGLLDVNRLMWGSDYPHVEGVWPRSRQQIAHDFAGVPAEEVDRIVALNRARLFGFPVPALV